MKCLATTGRTLAIFLLAVTGSPGMGQGSDDSALNALMTRLEPIRTLNGEFRQETLNESGRRAREQTGEFWLERPDSLYWLSREPYEQALYVDGETVWVYEADLMQATRQPLDNQLNQSPALVLTGNRSAIDERYVVERINDSQVQVRFRLTPRDDSGQVQELTLGFTGELPEQLILEDSFGQTTEVTFRNLIANAEPPTGIFDFDPPEGTDVLEQAGP